MTNKEAITKLEDIDRFDAYHLSNNEFTEDDHNSIREVINWLKSLDDRPIGKWDDTEFQNLKQCSNCKARWGIYSIEDFDYCPTCGARMEAENE